MQHNIIICFISKYFCFLKITLTALHKNFVLHIFADSLSPPLKPLRAYINTHNSTHKHTFTVVCAILYWTTHKLCSCLGWEVTASFELFKEGGHGNRGEEENDRPEEDVRNVWTVMTTASAQKLTPVLHTALRRNTAHNNHICFWWRTQINTNSHIIYGLV